MDFKKSDKKKSKKQIQIGGNILVDLMPQSRREVLETRALKKKWFFGSIGVFAACVVTSLLVYSGSVSMNLDSENETTIQNQVALQISKYAGLNQALESQEMSNGYLSKSASTESDWSKLFSNVENALPSGTEITSMKVSLGSGKKPEATGVLTMNFSSTTTLGYSDTLRAIQSLPGVSSVEIGGLTVGGAGYSYSMAFAQDASILTGRFVQEETNGKPGLLNQNSNIQGGN